MSQVYSKDFASESNEPLLILLHGWGSNEHDLPGLADVLNTNLDYVAPRAPFAADSPGVFEGGYAWGYAWFKDPVVEREKRDVEAKNAGDIFLEWLGQQEKCGKINPKRKIIILGFSQGGAMVCHLLCRNELKGRLMGAIMLSGYLPFNSDDVFATDDISVFHGFGDADEIVDTNESNRAKNWFKKNFTQLTSKSYSNMMHSINLDEAKDIANFINNL